MKKINLVIQKYSINKIIGNKLGLSLPDNANVIDVIRKADEMICEKDKFPSEHYCSLLHWVYNPVKNRFYEQTGITVYTGSRELINVRDNPKKKLPDGVEVTLIPEGGCITAWEEVLSYEEFIKAISK